MQIKMVSKSVNGKALFVIITDFVEEVIRTLGVEWDSPTDRQATGEYISDWMEYELIHDKKLITQFDVICDTRNNPKLYDGSAFLTILYRETNCINQTRLIYEITTEGSDNTNDLLSYFAVP